LLLQRYGVVARELAVQEGWMLPCACLYEVLSRLELTGEVASRLPRRGAVGAQFALPEAVTQLQQTHAPSTRTPR